LFFQPVRLLYRVLNSTLPCEVGKYCVFAVASTACFHQHAHLQWSCRSLEPTKIGSKAAGKDLIMSKALKNTTAQPKRNNRIEFYVNEKEYQQVVELQRVTKLSKSALMRKLILGKKIRPAPPDIYYDIYYLMQTLANNANQIARIVNATGNINADKVGGLLIMIDKCFEKLERLG